MKNQLAILSEGKTKIRKMLSDENKNIFSDLYKRKKKNLHQNNKIIK